MTKFSIAAIVLLLCSLSARPQAIELGGGLSYGSGINNAGVNLKGNVRIDDHWAVSPHFNFFFNRNDGMITHRWWAFNIDGHYYFEIEDLLSIYPLLGFNIGVVKENLNSINFSDTGIGMNLGGGLQYQFTDALSGFGEIKYVIGNADQLVVTVGILYRIQR